MKHTISSLILLAAAFAAQASTSWTLQGRQYNVDTLYHAQIGPGTTQTSLRLSGAQNLRVFYVTTDLTNPNVDLRVAQASKNLTGGAKLSGMQKANDKAGARYFAGVNADFFSGNQPCGSSVVNGDVYKAVNTGWDSWYMTTDRKPGIAALYFKGTASCGDNSNLISGINLDRGEGSLILYNYHRGATTGTNQWGSETTLEPVDGAVLGYNGVTRWKVKTTPSVQGEGGSTALANDGCIVLSGHGFSATFVRSLNVGDIVTIDLNTVVPDGGIIQQLAGGMPILLKDGVTLDTQNSLDHLTALNPRTAVGHSADGTKVVLMVVDGRQSGVSVGVVSRVLADMMREVGCSEAMNFDGGGSSELYTSAFGVRNKPSDGNERSVVNSVWTVCTAPDDNEVASIAFMNTTITLPKYGYFKPVIYGYNKYGMLVDTELKGYTLSCDEALGHITDGGETLFADGAGYHALTATFGNATATIPVAIGTARPQLRLAEVILDSYRDYRAEVQALVEDTYMEIDSKALAWTVADAAVATVSDEGVIRGINCGTTTVTGTVGDFTGTLPVIVEIPSSRHMALDPDLDINTWTTSKTGLSALTISPIGTDGIAADYTVSSTRGTQLTLRKVATFYSRPDSIRLVINPGDANITKINLNVATKGARPDAYTIEPKLQANTDNVILVPLSDIVDVDDFASYPVEFSSLAFYVGDAVKAQRRIEISAIEGVYVNAPEGNSGIGSATAGKQTLRARVAGRTVLIDCPADARLSVFNTAGTCLMQTTGSTLDAAALPAGIYLVSVLTGNTVDTIRIAIK